MKQNSKPRRITAPTETFAKNRLESQVNVTENFLRTLEEMARLQLSAKINPERISEVKSLETKYGSAGYRGLISLGVNLGRRLHPGKTDSKEATTNTKALEYTLDYVLDPRRYKST